MQKHVLLFSIYKCISFIQSMASIDLPGDFNLVIILLFVVSYQYVRLS